MRWGNGLASLTSLIRPKCRRTKFTLSEVELSSHRGRAALRERFTLAYGEVELRLGLLGAREAKDLLEVASERLELLAKVGAPEPFALHEGS